MHKGLATDDIRINKYLWVEREARKGDKHLFRGDTHTHSLCQSVSVWLSYLRYYQHFVLCFIFWLWDFISTLSILCSLLDSPVTGVGLSYLVSFSLQSFPVLVWGILAPVCVQKSWDYFSRNKFSPRDTRNQNKTWFRSEAFTLSLLESYWL